MWKWNLARLLLNSLKEDAMNWKYLIVKKLSKYILINSSRAGIYLLKLNTVNTAKSAQIE